MSFWKKLEKPISILAPMYDVTDVVFREVISQVAKPNVMFTEFVNCDAFCSSGRLKVESKFKFTEEQRPMVAQIWGINPETHVQTARELAKMGYDGIDLNMGCPQKGEMKIGSCAALINNHELAHKLIEAVKEGAGDVPVSVKTRVGVNKVVTEEWIGFLLEHDLEAITIHARTAKDMSNVPADWEQIRKSVKLRDKMGKNTLIIGNGDVKNSIHGERLCKEYGCNGYMIGRGIFTDPWAFSKTQNVEVSEKTKEDFIKVLKLHLDLYEKEYGDKKRFNVLKKFFKIYIRDFEDAKEMREKMMECRSISEVRGII